LFSVLAMNRDESFARETEPLHYWNDLGIYGGRDMEKGGTWLAINRKGRLYLEWSYFIFKAGSSRLLISKQLVKITFRIH
jgi:hypothetical protein